MTIFADDKILCWRVRSMKALEKAMSQINTVLDALDKACVKVNFSKSEVLLLLRGKRADEARRRFVCVRGGEGHLRIPSAASSAYFAIKSQIRYLGVVLSYGALETQNALEEDTPYRMEISIERSPSSLWQPQVNISEAMPILQEPGQKFEFNCYAMFYALPGMCWAKSPSIRPSSCCRGGRQAPPG